MARNMNKTVVFVIMIAMVVVSAGSSTEINVNFADMFKGYTATSSTCPPSVDKFQAFKSSLSSKAQVLTPDSNEYEAKYNSFPSASASLRVPVYIVQVAEPADFVKTVNFARDNNYDFGVLGGGHGGAGLAHTRGGVLLDTSNWKAVTIDAVNKLAVIQSGARIGDVDAAARNYSLAAVNGNCYTVGMGSISYGGYGALARLHGLAIDNIVEYQLVTSKGEIITVNETLNSDLYWGLRGSLPAFGVAISFKVRLHDVSSFFGGQLVVPAAFFVPVAKFVRANSENPNFHARMDVAQTPQGKIAITEFAYWGNTLTRDQKVAFFANFTSSLPVVLASTIGQFTYWDSQNALNPIIDASNKRLIGYGVTGSMSSVGDDFLATYSEILNSLPASDGPSAFQLWGGAISQKAVGDTAFAPREAKFSWFILLESNDASKLNSFTEVARNASSRLKSFAGHVPGYYTNWAVGSYSASEAFATNLPRLTALKRIWDPTNLFKHNYQIPL